MTNELEEIFENFGKKKVTKTDKNKNAYVLNKSQLAAVMAANLTPMQGQQFDVNVLFDPDIKTVAASYYNAARAEDKNRTPEPRMGREFIRTWLDVGDEVIIGNIGNQIFALKTNKNSTFKPNVSNDEVMVELVKKGGEKAVIDKAKQAKGKPKRKEVKRSDFVRNPYVVAAAIVRAKGACEMLNCSRSLFQKDDKSNYLEVHHIVTLADGGDDTLLNAAALCPHCHRELHFGINRKQLQMQLIKHIEAISI